MINLLHSGFPRAQEKTTAGPLIALCSIDDSESGYRVSLLHLSRNNYENCSDYASCCVLGQCVRL